HLLPIDVHVSEKVSHARCLKRRTRGQRGLEWSRHARSTPPCACSSHGYAVGGELLSPPMSHLFLAKTTQLEPDRLIGVVRDSLRPKRTKLMRWPNIIIGLSAVGLHRVGLGEWQSQP